MEEVPGGGTAAMPYLLRVSVSPSGPHRKEVIQMSETKQIGKWIYAREIPQAPEQVTKRWAIVATDGEVELGEVKWWGKWRCYAYFPLNNTLYEKQCLRDIANFCESKTTEQRERAKGK